MTTARIVIVEDERIVAFQLKQQLIKLGYDVPAVATSSVQALQAISEFRPDMVLMDINIDGDIDGIETASRIPEEYKTPVIYLTAYSEMATLRRARETNQYGYLIKPYSEHDLLATIQMALGRRAVEAAMESAAVIADLQSLTDLRRQKLEISSLKEAAEQDNRLIDKLTTSNEAAGHFVYAASHDIRAPLHMMSSFASLLSARYSDVLDESGKKFLSRIIAGSVQLNLLLDNLLAFAGYGSPRTEQPSWFSADETLKAVVLIFGDPIRASGAQILCASPLPLVYGNSTSFHRLMQNLIGNALEYVAPGVAPVIRVSAERSGDFWIFSVADNGIGIDACNAEQIFEPFKRLHSHDDYAGTGLGLAICRKIAESFGGQIWVSSVKGEGSTFSFTMKFGDEAGNA